MHSNTEGLNPSLRAQLGVGWNRALPAPFSFQNGWLPDGVNDYLLVPTLQLIPFISEFTVELWFNINAFSASTKTWIALQPSPSLSPAIVEVRSNGSGIVGLYNGSAPSVSSFSVSFTSPNHFAFTINAGVAKFYINGNFINSTTVAVYAGMIDKFIIGAQNTTPAQLNNHKIDEFRYYSEALTDSDVVTNYNFGLGNNPCKTEKLLCWLDFEVSESDTALYPAGNPSGWPAGAWGLRDKSGKQNHAMQVNQVNNATLGGTIQAF